MIFSHFITLYSDYYPYNKFKFEFLNLNPSASYIMLGGGVFTLTSLEKGGG
nr:hypothetical protein [Cressdnaviricota sp.]UOF82856.1 hypothetical protein [Cressdnaviricota sp.]